MNSRRAIPQERVLCQARFSPTSNSSTLKAGEEKSTRSTTTILTRNEERSLSVTFAFPQELQHILQQTAPSSLPFHSIRTFNCSSRYFSFLCGFHEFCWNLVDGFRYFYLVSQGTRFHSFSRSLDYCRIKFYCQIFHWLVWFV